MKFDTNLKGINAIKDLKNHPSIGQIYLTDKECEQLANDLREFQGRKILVEVNK